MEGYTKCELSSGGLHQVLAEKWKTTSKCELSETEIEKDIEKEKNIHLKINFFQFFPYFHFFCAAILLS